MNSLSLITGAGIGVSLSLLLCNNSRNMLVNLLKISSTSTKLKLSFIVRTDIQMTSGKIASQCAHAAIGCYSKAPKNLVQHWELLGQPKIVLKSDKPGESNLLKIQEEAKQLGLTTSIVRDAGRTQVTSGTTTVLGIGPGPTNLIDSIVGHLKLL